MVSLPLHFVFPPQFQFFLTASSFQLNCSSVGRAGRPPSVNKGIKCPSLPYLPATRLQKAAAVILPLHFIFFPTISIFFSQLPFSKIAHHRPRRSPSLSQLRDQGPVAAIPACDSPAEGDGREFVSPFYFSSHHLSLLLDVTIVNQTVMKMIDATHNHFTFKNTDSCTGKPT